MIRVADGPAADQALMLKHAPLWLRVVRSPTGKWDALDAPGDQARPRETIFVYQRIGEPSTYHMKMSTCSGSGFYQRAAYRHWTGVQPDQSTLRNETSWLAWCEEGGGPRLAAIDPVQP